MVRRGGCTENVAPQGLEEAEGRLESMSAARYGNESEHSTFQGGREMGSGDVGRMVADSRALKASQSILNLVWQEMGSH